MLKEGIKATTSSDSNNVSTTLNWDDLTWLHFNSIGIRNVDGDKGTKEVAEGGFGDAYSLATMGILNGYKMPDTIPDSPEKQEFSLLLNRLRTTGRFNQSYSFVFNSKKIDNAPELKASLVVHANNALLETCYQCNYNAGFRTSKKSDMYILMQNFGAASPHDVKTYKKDDLGVTEYSTGILGLYSLGKCGSYKFSANSVAGSVRQGVDFDYKRKADEDYYKTRPDELESDLREDAVTAKNAIVKLIKQRPKFD